MKEVQLISNDYPSRMKEILDESWKIFKSQFVHKRNDIDKEAPFQLQFASIIKNVGELYTIRNTSDRYETNGGTVHKYDGKGGKTDKYDSIELKGSYRFEWEHCMEDNWYFLKLDITK